MDAGVCKTCGPIPSGLILTHTMGLAGHRGASGGPADAGLKTGAFRTEQPFVGFPLATKRGFLLDIPFVGFWWYQGKPTHPSLPTWCPSGWMASRRAPWRFRQRFFNFFCGKGSEFSFKPTGQKTSHAPPFFPMVVSCSHGYVEGVCCFSPSSLLFFLFLRLVWVFSFHEGTESWTCSRSDWPLWF